MTERHYPWDVLEIDETDDKKSIKKAYAVLIKQYKPDEHPDKFQEVQEAYKYALLSIYQLSKEVTVFENSESITIIDIKDEYNVHEEEILKKLLKNLKEKTFSKKKDKDNLKNWTFLEIYYGIENLKFKDKIAKIVFQNVAGNNLFLMKGYDRLLINPKVLIYMNRIFDWTTKWQEYGRLFPQEYFIVTLDYIENNRSLDYFILVEDFLEGINSSIDKGSQKIINVIEVPTKRFWSFVIDLLLPLFILRYIDYVDAVNNHSGVSYILIFIGLRVVFEILTNSHSSIGKIILRLKIVDKDLSRISKKQIFTRHIVLLVLLTPFIFIFKVSSIYENTLIMACGIVFVANIILMFTHKKLLHDLLSKTHIVNTK